MEHIAQSTQQNSGARRFGVRLHERTKCRLTVVDAGCRVRDPSAFDTRSYDCVDTALVRSMPCRCCRAVNTAALLAADLAACVSDLFTQSDAVVTSSRSCSPKARDRSRLDCSSVSTQSTQSLLKSSHSAIHRITIVLLCGTRLCF